MLDNIGKVYADDVNRLSAVQTLINDVNNCKGQQTRLLEQSLLDNLEGLSNKVKQEGKQTATPYSLVAEDKTYSLAYGENKIGRAKDNDVVIEDGHVSRYHAVIVVHSDDGVEIFESSRNGTSVNGRLIAHSLLKVGDEIVIAPRSYSYKLVLSHNNQLQEESAVDNFEPIKTAKPKKTNTKEHRLSSVKNFDGFSLIELLIVIAILGIISSIAVLNIVSSRRAANSASAVQSLRLISSSQSSYSSGVGNGDYATTEELVKEEYIDTSLAAATLPTPTNITQKPKSGYLFLFQQTPSNSSTSTLANYQVLARPLLGNGLARAGDKSFFVDATGVIRVSPSATAPFADSNSQPLN